MINFKAWRSARFATAKPQVTLALTVLVVSLVGCAAQQDKVDLVTPEPPASPDPVLVYDKPFPVDTLYSLLVAEIAGDRQRFDIMLGNYVQQAEQTQDPGVAARAARLARYLKAHAIALEMTTIWLDREPHNAEAHFIAMAELVHANRLQEAMDHAEFLLDRDEVSGFDSIAMRAQHGGDIETTQALIKRYQALIQKHPKQAQLHLGLSLLQQHAGDLEAALQSSQKAIRLDPEGFQAAAQETRVLQQMGKTDQALAKLGLLVDRYAENPRLRLQYARALLKTDLAAAQEQFELILQHSPGDTDITLTLALVNYERGLLDQAKELFLQLVDNPRYQSTSNYYLGRIARVKNDPNAAEAYFGAVGPSSEYIPAQSQLSEILVDQGRIDEALTMVRNKRTDQAHASEHIVGLYLLESQLLSSQGQTLNAIALLDQATAEFPDSTRLFYSRAMLFTQLDDLAAAEKDFKRVLAISPEHAAALNAWGYTLADRAERLDEAYQMISKAYRLTPDDPAVIDSMGWVEYRLGNISKALIILRKAMAVLPDHEIAAHLGEVLWVSGEHEEAQQVWQQGLQNNPNSDVIHSTIRRLNAN